MTKDIKEIEAKSENLLPTSDTGVQKSLESVFDQSKKLSQKITRIQADVTKGDFFLAQRKFDVENYRKILSTIDLKTAFEPLEPLSETDIEGFLKHEHNMIIKTAIEEAKKLTSNQFYSSFESHMNNEWKHSKDNLVQLLSKGSLPVSTNTTTSFTPYRPQAPQSYSIAATPATPAKRGHTSMDARMIAYADVVYALNEARIADTSYPLIEEFKNCCAIVDGSHARKREMEECWKMLKMIVEEDKQANKPGHSYKKSYQEQHKQLVQTFVNNAKRYLELQYLEYVYEQVKRTTTIPIPSWEEVRINESKAHQIVRAHVSHLAKGAQQYELLQDDDNIPVWVLLYMLLRCGLVKSASELANRANTLVSEMARKQFAYLAAKASAIGVAVPLLQQQEESLQTEYTSLKSAPSSSSSSSRDLFKVAVFGLLCKDTTTYVQQVCSKAEDYMWLKLSMINDKTFTIATLQDKIRKSKSQLVGKAPSLLYFKYLLLSQMFEEAIEHLSSREMDGYQVEAIHFAIAMNYYGILNVSKPSQPLCTILSNNMHALNFYFLLKNYVRLFAHTDARNAVSYFYLIDDEQVMLNYMRDLVIESKDVSTLLGSIDTKKATRKPGCMERLIKKPEQLRKIVQDAANDYEKKGRYDTAIDLFCIAQELMSDNAHPKETLSIFQRILAIINQELSSVLISGDGRQPTVDKAKMIYQRLSKNQAITKDKLFEAFVCFLRLIDLYDLVHQNKLTQAWQLLSTTIRMIPTQASEIDGAVTRFNNAETTLKQRYPDILVTAMNILFAQYKQEKDNYSQASKQAIQSFRERSMVLITFAGYIQQHMPTYLHQQLVRLDVAMR